MDGELNFRKATFQKTAHFENMRVEGKAKFDEATFGNSTSFQGTVFKCAPDFYRANLHAETKFNLIDDFDKQFPDIKSKGAMERYRVLKGLMQEHHAISEQLGFHRLELKAEAHDLGRLNLNRLFGWTSDYGLSWRLPLLWLLLLAGIFFLAYHFMLPNDLQNFGLLLALNIAFPFVGALKILGLDRALQDSGNFSLGAKYIVAALSVIQNILSAIFLFLIGLGIRNRLRMK